MKEEWKSDERTAKETWSVELRTVFTIGAEWKTAAAFKAAPRARLGLRWGPKS